MKIAVLFGSPKKNGSTAKLLDSFLSSLQNFTTNYTVKIFRAYDIMPRPCMDCGFCAVNKECRCHDMDELVDELLRSDLLVIASPVYNYSFPAPLKAIIDRFQRFFDKEKIYPLGDGSKPRKGILLVAAGKSGKFSFDVVEKQAKMAFMMLDAQYIGKLTAAKTDTDAVSKPDIAEIELIYNKIFDKK